MIKYIVGIVAIIIVLGGVLYYLELKAPAGALSQTGAPSQQLKAATSTYATTTFSLVYPADFTAADFSNTEVSEKKPIAGVKISIPGTMATGTNLASDSFLSVEQLPHAKSCTGDIYLKDTVKPVGTTDNGVAYSVATTSGAAAGNSYEESVYAIVGSAPCTAVRYFIHSSDINNYPPGSVQPFDRTKLISVFDDIRRSVTLTIAPAAASASSTTP